MTKPLDINSLLNWQVKFQEVPPDPDLSNITVTETIRNNFGKMVAPEEMERYQIEESKRSCLDLRARICKVLGFSLLIALKIACIALVVLLITTNPIPSSLVLFIVAAALLGPFFAVIGVVTEELHDSLPKNQSPQSIRNNKLSEIENQSLERIYYKISSGDPLFYNLFPLASEDRENQLKVYAAFQKLEDHYRLINSNKRRDEEALNTYLKEADRQISQASRDYQGCLRLRLKKEGLADSEISFANDGIINWSWNSKSKINEWKEEQLENIKERYKPAYEALEKSFQKVKIGEFS